MRLLDKSLLGYGARLVHNSQTQFVCATVPCAPFFYQALSLEIFLEGAAFHNWIKFSNLFYLSPDSHEI